MDESHTSSSDNTANNTSKEEHPASDFSPLQETADTHDSKLPQQERGEVLRTFPGRKKAIRTFESDVAETIRNQKLSVAKIAIKEKERAYKTKTTEPVETHEEPGKTRRAAIAVISGILILGGLSAVTYALLVVRPHSIQTTQTMQDNSILPGDEVRSIDSSTLTRSGLLDALTKEFERKDIPSDSLISLEIVQNTALAAREDVPTHISPAAFFAKLETRAPGNLVRSFSEKYMIGISTALSREFFIILKVSSFENALAGMLQWDAFLPEDIPFLVRKVVKGPLPPVSEATTTVTTASTTISTGTVPDTNSLILTPDPVFKDIIVKNKDTRAHMGTHGEIDLIYSFYDKETLVLTSSKEKLIELFDRLSTAKFTR